MDISALTSVPPILWLILFAVGLIVLFITRDRTSRQRLLSLLGYVLIIIILLAAIPAIRPYPSPAGAFITAEEQARFARTFGGPGVTEQVSQNYYTIITNATAPPLEGDYSDWTIYDSFDDLDLYDSLGYHSALVNGLETEIILIDPGNAYAKRYTIATKTLSNKIVDKLWGVGGGTQIHTSSSIQGTYWVALWATSTPVSACDHLSIVKNGVVIKTLTNSDLGFGTDFIRSASISRSGKYIIVSGRRTATGNMGWVILEGS